MECVEKKHFTDLAKGLAYYVLNSLSNLESKDAVNTTPEYLTDLVIARMKSLCNDRQTIEKWLSSKSLRESVMRIFDENLS